jgi:hypothetical protein
MLMRRVAPDWRAVIDDSRSLMRKLWLAPQQLDHEWYLSPGADVLRKRPARTEGAAAAAASGNIVYRSGIANPFLFKKNFTRPGLCQPIWTSEFHNSWVSSPLFIRESVTKPKIRKARSLFLKMFATQPPVKVMYLRIRSGGENMFRSYRCLVEQVKKSKGVKVGDVLRAVSHLSHNQKTAIVVDRMMFDVDWASEISMQPWAFRRYGHEG